MIFDEAKWSTLALDSQNACNPIPLLQASLDCLKEWRDSGGDWAGKECIPFRFLLHQIAYLSGTDEYGYPGGFTLYGKHTERLEKAAV